MTKQNCKYCGGELPPYSGSWTCHHCGAVLPGAADSDFHKEKEHRQFADRMKQIRRQKIRTASIITAVIVGLGMIATAWGLNVYRRYHWIDMVAISTSGLHTAGLKADGTVKAVGSNAYHQCEVFDWKNIVQIDTGDQVTIGLKSDGTAEIACDRANDRKAIESWTDLVSVGVADGINHVYGIKTDGTVVMRCTGSHHADCVICRGFSGLSGQTNIRKISGRFVLRTDGTVQPLYHIASEPADEINLQLKYVDLFGEIAILPDGSVRNLMAEKNGFETWTWDNIVKVSGRYALRRDGTIEYSGLEKPEALQWTDIVDISSDGRTALFGVQSDGTVICQCKYRYWDQPGVGNYWNMVFDVDWFDE